MWKDDFFLDDADNSGTKGEAYDNEGIRTHSLIEL